MRFIQLPFEVSRGDTLVFNLLDDDELTGEDEQRIRSGCRISGYCLLLGGTIYAPSAARLVAPIAAESSKLPGETLLRTFSLSTFDNYGTAEFVVSDQLPRQPSQANRLTLLDDSSYSRIQLRLYAPASALDLTLPGATAASPL